MWKDFFYFSKSERRAILFLLTLLFIFMCIWVLFPVKEESLEQDQEGIEEIKNFLAGVHEMEEKESLRYSYDKPKRREVVLAAFDPNSADSIEFLQRGFLLLLHILFCNTGEPAVNSGQRMISLVFMACRPRNLIC